MPSSKHIRSRLAYLRREIEHERISYGELCELQSLADHIDPADALLRGWAGIPEFPEEQNEQKDNIEVSP